MTTSFGRFCVVAAALTALLSLSGCQHEASYGTESASPERAIPKTVASASKSVDKKSDDAKPDVATSTESNNASNTAADETANPKETVAEAPTLREVTFDTLKFTHEKGTPFQRSLLTPTAEKLDGKPIRIRGYMLPSFKQSGLTEFVLVRDNMQCCFGKGAALCDCIVVQMEKGRSAEYSLRPVAIEGIFKIHEWKGSEGETMAVYHLDGQSVK